MHPFRTDDGSISYRKTPGSQPYHTKNGAVVEALEKHARALRVWERKDPVIFDICSGLAYSAACALEEIRNHSNDSLVTIYLMENDPVVIERIIDLPEKLEYIRDDAVHYIESFADIQNAARLFLRNGQKVYEKEKLRIIFLLGDFEQTINEVATDADFVFYAPFSPEYTPEMWTKEKFSLIYSHMAENSKLSTYAYARVVKESMKAAGFRLEDGPVLGRRSPSLIGLKD